MTRRFEQGNVGGFVLIGVLLTGLLVGGVWLARHPINSSQVATDSNSSTTQKDTTSTPNSNTDTAKATTDEELKEALARQAAQSLANGSSSTSSTSSGSTTTSLPTTGPADTLFEMVGATALAGMTVAYIRSRSAA